MHTVTEQEVASSWAAIKLTRTFAQHPAAPEAHRSPGAAGSSIFGMLEVIEIDFTKKLAEPSLAEDEAENGFQMATERNNVTKDSQE